MLVRAPSTAAIQAVHLIAVHGLCAEVDAAVSDRPGLDSPFRESGSEPAGTRQLRNGRHELHTAALDSELTG